MTNVMSKLPEYVPYDLDDYKVQEIAVRRQADTYVAIIQWDGTGEFQHWVLVPISDVDAFIEQVRQAAAQ